jgi:hypothetical protein
MFKNSVFNLPILRKYIKTKGIIKEPMPKYAFLQIFQVILKKAGYFTEVIIHAVRRGLSKKIDGKSLTFKSLFKCLFFSLEDRRTVFAPVN